MSAWTRRAGSRGITGAAAMAAAMLAAAAPAALAQQSLAERLGLDNLRLSGLGVGYGTVYPARVETTNSYTVSADYGELAPHWSVIFSASYWGSRFKREAVDGFVAQLRASIIDPAQDDTIRAGRVAVSDIAVEGALRYTPVRHGLIEPYLSGGLGAHVVNVESPFLEGTFIESALDNIATAISATAGVDIVPSTRFTFGVQARYTLLANVRFGALRAMGSYHFAFPPTLAPASP